MSIENKPESFGFNTAWLTFRTENTEAVAAALNLIDAIPTNWPSGIEAAYESNQVFISPPVKGWTFAVGTPFYGAAEDSNRSMEPLKTLLRTLSSQFGEVQGFATQRTVEYHHWLLARSGNIVRSSAYLGETGEILDDEGARTADEPAIHLEPDDEFDVPDEDTVMSIAGAWSLDPQNLDEEPVSITLGVLGSCHLAR